MPEKFIAVTGEPAVTVWLLTALADGNALTVPVMAISRVWAPGEVMPMLPDKFATGADATVLI